MHGVVYEPNGPHIFHTDDEAVAAFVTRFGMRRRYVHEVLTCVHIDDADEPTFLSWPLQVEELRQLSIWPTIERELRACPERPLGSSFEEYAVSLMGETLYRTFIYGYTVKQWGRDPSTLSSSFAPRRIDLRTDGDRRLFRDRHQYFETRGFNRIVENIASCATVHTDTMIGVTELVDGPSSIDAWVVTAPLDEFVGRDGALAWRGVETRARHEVVDGPTMTLTPAYVVNYPDLRYGFTRTVETKHASGQHINGTVVCEEYPGAPARHYPVHTVDREHDRLNDQLKHEIRRASPVTVEFCGRLANYEYINQDEAIRQGIDAAGRVLRGARP
jgi:UDP-galactopyranose mutase